MALDYDQFRLLAQQRMRQALAEKRFFKFIGGGSLTEVRVLKKLFELYVHAGADCIDIAPDIDVLNTVAEVIEVSNHQSPPAVMVSIPLDPDPHFRKIELKSEDCIVCEACLPVCPTQALTLSSKVLEADLLEVSQTLCYGCGRCVPVCPTDALVLHPFLVADQIIPVLTHPMVSAVEIHSQFMDPFMLRAFLNQYGHLLQDKLVSVCFRPETVPELQALDFLSQLQAALPLPILVQIDGAPMSGTADPLGSLPALQSAASVKNALLERLGSDLPITISGGINVHTTDYLMQAEYAFIAGVGMGSYARQVVWPYLTLDVSGDASAQITQAVAEVTSLCQRFGQRTARLAKV